MPKRPVHMPLWSVVVLCVMATFGPLASIVASIQIADRNAAELIDRYEADQQRVERQVEQEKLRTQAEAKAVYCRVFSTQIDALDNAQTESGEAARQGWIDLYKLAECQPPRK